jgi:hypothetical protein
MSAVTKRKLTDAEYEEIEHTAEFKSEFYNGECSRCMVRVVRTAWRARSMNTFNQGESCHGIGNPFENRAMWQAFQ